MLIFQATVFSRFFTKHSYFYGKYQNKQNKHKDKNRNDPSEFTSAHYYVEDYCANVFSEVSDQLMNRWHNQINR